MQRDGFDFKKRDPTGYAWGVAKSHKAELEQRRLSAQQSEERDALRKASGGQLYQRLGGLVR